MLRQSENLVHRLFARQTTRAPPNAHVLEVLCDLTYRGIGINGVRKLYENIVPSHTVYDVDCPDHAFRKFTNDGQYLICFSRNHQDLIVYRHNWLSYCRKGDDCDTVEELPPKSRKFDTYFTQLYVVSLASGNEVVCKEFFLTTENNLFGIFATSTPPDYSAAPSPGSVPGVPSIERISISLVRLSDGVVVDERVFHDDFINLSHNMGVFLYDDLLVILSVRYQCIYILQVREAGLLVDVRSIGAYCREDDELRINTQAQEEASFQQHQAAIRKARGVLADAESQECPPDQQKKGLPFCWTASNNLKPRSRQNGRLSRGQSSGWPGHASGGNASLETTIGSPVIPTGIYGGAHGADIDLQYDGYFRGFFASLDQGHRQQLRGQATEPHRVELNPSQENLVRVRLEANGSEAATLLDGRTVGMQFTRAFSPYESVYGSQQQRTHNDALASTSGSGSGSQHAGTAPSSWQTRSFSSASVESGEYLTSGRTSYSYRASSTSMTSTTCSGSGSGSGSSRRDRSTTGGSMSYGEAGAGSVSMNSAEGSHVEYVVSSRTSRGHASGPANMDVDEAGIIAASAATATGGNLLAASQLATNNLLPPLLGSRSVDVRLQSRNTAVQNGPQSVATQEHPSVGPTSSLLANGSRRTPITANRSNLGPRTNGTLSRDGRIWNSSTANVRAGTTLRQDGDLAVNTGMGLQGAANQGGQMLGGLKQRLLSFIFQGTWNEDVDPLVKAQRLKRFYYHFQHYEDLVMWKVQFLDRYHLLIKFGSVDAVVARNSDNSNQTAFFAIYNLETTEMLGFYQNTSEEFLLSYEHFCDHFRVVPSYPMFMSFITSHSNNVYARDQFRKQKAAFINSKAGSLSQVVKRTLATLPFNSQSHSPSPYFDPSLFHFDEKLVSAIDRHKPCMEHPVKFISRRRPNFLKFKVNPGLELGSNDGRVKRVASFIFHPIYPFAISVQQSFMQPTIVNFHFRK